MLDALVVILGFGVGLGIGYPVINRVLDSAKQPIRKGVN